MQGMPGKKYIFLWSGEELGIKKFENCFISMKIMGKTLQVPNLCIILCLLKSVERQKLPVT